MTEHPEQPRRPLHYTEEDVQREVSELETKSATAARIFDLRRIIGGLFVVYGVIVTITGITDSQAAIDKAEGVNINLWTGIGMLLLGIFFLAWLKLRPTPPPVPPEGLPEERGGE
ncbi:MULTISPECIES: hypothetical protein [Streptomyces]|uniref:Integral membrane protein n=1 Tax=Streptomyces tricolor TaxID=68277 RepID=A0ABS9JQA4_9ACTN|nr:MULTISPECIES: hypothetical protein [Streptomyces]MYU28762.1 hypothetical protein [Streptomyces sp. SID7810]CUW29805.1 hypothetical protein TUE45_04516 [Streptomyces reticuli]AKN72448.1 membrane protein [Streptomyces sp. PBH53]MCG0067750.1 hypothetical protein [Streptomyces tricolor]BCM67426.1 hypothetical protein EASAB2608_02760 [Streptomyces sp. EAS-AB2608]